MTYSSGGLKFQGSITSACASEVHSEPKNMTGSTINGVRFTHVRRTPFSPRLTDITAIELGWPLTFKLELTQPAGHVKSRLEGLT